MSSPTLQLSEEHFEKFREYLLTQKLAFEDRPHQVFLARKPGLAVNLYTNGKILISGTNTAAVTLVREFVKSLGAKEILKTGQQLVPLNQPFPHIGTDEVGKGDYFGYLVIAGALVPADKVESLSLLGVRDSKTLSDNTIRNIASQIRIVLERQCLRSPFPT